MKDDKTAVDELRERIMAVINTRGEPFETVRASLVAELDARCKAGDLPTEWRAGTQRLIEQADRITALEAERDAQYPTQEAMLEKVAELEAENAKQKAALCKAHDDIVDTGQQFEELEAENAAMTEDRDLRQGQHNEDCPNLAERDALKLTGNENAVNCDRHGEPIAYIPANGTCPACALEAERAGLKEAFEEATHGFHDDVHRAKEENAALRAVVDAFTDANDRGD
jgi:hypothetical protein